MKWTGFGALACAALFTVACAGDTRDRNDDDVDRPAAAGTSGADTTQSAGFDNDNDANDGAGLDSKGDAQAQIGANVDSGQGRIAVGTSGRTLTQGEMHGASGDARHFAQTIAMHNTAEIQLGQLAAERAQNTEVKQFAQMMVRDHTKAGNELKQAVSGQNVDLTARQMDQKHEMLMARLRTLRGAEFDREYMKAMVDGHNEVSRLLQMHTGANARNDARTHGGTNPTGTSGTGAAATSAPRRTTQLDTAVHHWATETLPTVQQHLQKAQQIHGKVEGGDASTRPGNTDRGSNTSGTSGNDTRR